LRFGTPLIATVKMFYRTMPQITVDRVINCYCLCAHRTARRDSMHADTRSVHLHFPRNGLGRGGHGAAAAAAAWDDDISDAVKKQ